MFDNIILNAVEETIEKAIPFYVFSIISSSLLNIAIFIIMAIGIYEISKKAGFKKPWISFIPVISVFSVGRIAEKYVKNNGSKSSKFSVLLLVSYIVYFVAFISLIVFLFVSIFTITPYLKEAIKNGTQVSFEMFQSFILVILSYLVTIIVFLTYKILYYVSLWRIFAMLNTGNANIYIVLSVLFDFLGPIFLFYLRKKELKYTYEERVNLPSVELL